VIVNVLIGFHILFALTCVVTGVVAMLSKKRRGRHPRFGTIYFCSLALVWLTASVISLERWSQDSELFFLGTAAFASGSLGYAARRIRWKGWLPYHISGMGGSYIILLTAFYVDNGPRLPVWDRLPHFVYWLLPAAAGVPLILRAAWRRSSRIDHSRRRPGMIT
jgi:hypothetical protein